MRRPPKISVVTPTYNQSQYLPETIESVLDQGYEDLEYIVIDDGSTDETPEIIRRYAHRLTHAVRQPNRGQTNALRAGFDLATGDVLAWLNSDDCYEPGALQTAADAFVEWPDSVLVYGDYNVRDFGGRVDLKPKVSFDFNICLYAYLIIPQPSAFWTRAIYDEVGGLDPRFDYAMDYDLFLRIGHGREHLVRHLRTPLSTFRLHEKSKSVAKRDRAPAEYELLRSRYVRPNGAAFEARYLYEMCRLEWRFVRERRMLPLRKDPRKA